MMLFLSNAYGEPNETKGFYWTCIGGIGHHHLMAVTSAASAPTKTPPPNNQTAVVRMRSTALPSLTFLGLVSINFNSFLADTSRYLTQVLRITPRLDTR